MILTTQNKRRIRRYEVYKFEDKVLYNGQVSRQRIILDEGSYSYCLEHLSKFSGTWDWPNNKIRVKYRRVGNRYQFPWFFNTNKAFSHYEIRRNGWLYVNNT